MVQKNRFVSRTLTNVEQNYSQVEKEGLACVDGMKRFHSYLFGHKLVSPALDDILH